MSRQVPNVRTWSKTVPEHLFDLGDLDVYVLKEHTEVIAAMGRRRAPRGDLPEFGVVLASWIAPAVAVAGWVGNPRRDLEGFGSAADDAAAWCLAVAFLGVLIIGWRWLRSGRRWERLEVAGVVITVVAGGFSLAAMRSSSGVDVLGLAPVSLPAWFATVSSVLLGGAMAVASRGRREPFSKHFRVAGSADPQRVASLVDELEPRRREKLLDERRRALRRLRDRGLIDANQEDDVRSRPLGLSHGAGR